MILAPATILRLESTADLSQTPNRAETRSFPLLLARLSAKFLNRVYRLIPDACLPHSLRNTLILSHSTRPLTRSRPEANRSRLWASAEVQWLQACSAVWLGLGFRA